MNGHRDSGGTAGSEGSRTRRCVVLAETRRVLVDGVETTLGGRAFDLLCALLEHRGSVVPKQDLHDAIWPGVCVTPNNLDVQIWALRRCLGAEAISTVARRGYMLTDAVEFAVAGSASRTLVAEANRSEASASDRLDLLVERLARRLIKQGQLTLIGADPSTRKRVCDALCHAYLRLRCCTIWRIQMSESDDLRAHENTLRRMTRIGGLVVLTEGDASVRSELHRWLGTNQQSSSLSSLTTAGEAVAGIDCQTFAVTSFTNSGNTIHTEPPERTRLRWQSRRSVLSL